mmetsp:Transcript_22232/g.48599  ORF Transcript_22232/g.48599 Transcript_22232/m.48599 type:complete len:86 (+) Transcript_22232:272-529(+)
MKRGKTALLSMRCAAQRGHAPKAEMQDVTWRRQQGGGGGGGTASREPHGGRTTTTKSCGSPASAWQSPVSSEWCRLVIVDCRKKL